VGRLFHEPVWVFTRDPDSPNGRAVIDAGGRVTTVLDGWIAVLRPGNDPLPVAEVTDVPMTLAGLSRVNVEAGKDRLGHGSRDRCGQCWSHWA